MNKKIRLASLLILLFLYFTPMACRAEGKLNILGLCMTNEFEKGYNSMMELFKRTKLPGYRLNVYESYAKDLDKDPTTRENINDKFSECFGKSTGSDINLLYLVAHGYSGSDKGKPIANNTGFFFAHSGGSEDQVYLFSNLARKLSTYKGTFYCIFDTCYSGGFITAGLGKLSDDNRNRFHCICSTRDDEVGRGIYGVSTYFSLKMATGLVPRPKTITYLPVSGIPVYSLYLPADKNKDGLITMNEVYDYTKSFFATFSITTKFGDKDEVLFQFGYFKFKKSAVSVKLKKKTYTMNVEIKDLYGKNISLGGIYTTSFLDGIKVSLKSSNPDVASVDNKGKLTLKKAGTTTITATLTDKYGKPCLGSEDYCKVTVIGNPTINVSPSSLAMQTGEQKTLNASITNTNNSIKWKSSNTKIATVNKNGLIKAKKEGTVTITATVEGVSSKCKVTVKSKSDKKKAEKNQKKHIIDLADYVGKKESIFKTVADGWKKKKEYGASTYYWYGKTKSYNKKDYDFARITMPSEKELGEAFIGVKSKYICICGVHIGINYNTAHNLLKKRGYKKVNEWESYDGSILRIYRKGNIDVRYSYKNGKVDTIAISRM